MVGQTASKRELVGVSEEAHDDGWIDIDGHDNGIIRACNKLRKHACNKLRKHGEWDSGHLRLERAPAETRRCMIDGWFAA